MIVVLLADGALSVSGPSAFRISILDSEPFSYSRPSRASVSAM